MKNKNLLSIIALLIITGTFFTACQTTSNTAATDTNISSDETGTNVDEKNLTNPPAGTENTAGSTAENTATRTSVYQEGEYTGTGSYQSPAAIENVVVKVRIKADKIEDIDLTSDTQVETSKKYQGLFLQGLKQEVIGKDLAELGEFSKLNGSSLTSKGFNEALQKIKEEAKVS